MDSLTFADLSARLCLPQDTLRALLARVDAAALAGGSEDWIEMIAPGAEPDVKSALAALRTSGQAPAPWSADRLAAVRKTLRDQALDGFIVPQADPHMGEYIPARHQRLAWLSGFTGSAGLLVLHKDAAALFVDGRYTLQASQEVDAAAIETRHYSKPPAKEWLCERLAAGGRIGYDAKLFSIRQADDWREALERGGARLVAVAENPIDAHWPDQPPEPLSPMVPHPERYSGESLDDKCARLSKALQDDGLDAMMFNQLDAVAWLLNVRGNDVANMPVSVAYAVLHRDGTVDLYIDPLKRSDALNAHLGNRISVFAVDSIAEGMRKLGAEGKRIGLAADAATDWMRTTLQDSGATIVLATDPTELPRAIKNETERAGARAAHKRDAAALARTLKWLSDEAPRGGLTELDVVARLEREREQEALHRGPSFDTISGAGSHGAIVHYRVSETSNAAVAVGNLLLLDSGAQYLDGTTDITRTIAVGPVPDDAAACFTYVLKGHIALARAKFPAGTTGAQLDSLARQFLWRQGLNFDHGTGHGVGSYLGVHEGPQRISAAGHAKLQAGMILSNEPGYYREGAFGIRIENLLLVRPSDVAPDFLEFETLTFAPIDRSLITVALLDEEERHWLDAYHKRVFEIVGPQVPQPVRDWLLAATAPI